MWRGVQRCPRRAVCCKVLCARGDSAARPPPPHEPRPRGREVGARQVGPLVCGRLKAGARGCRMPAHEPRVSVRPRVRVRGRGRGKVSVRASVRGRARGSVRARGKACRAPAHELLVRPEALVRPPPPAVPRRSDAGAKGPVQPRRGHLGRRRGARRGGQALVVCGAEPDVVRQDGGLLTRGRVERRRSQAPTLCGGTARRWWRGRCRGRRRCRGGGGRAAGGGWRPRGGGARGRRATMPRR